MAFRHWLEIAAFNAVWLAVLFDTAALDQLTYSLTLVGVLAVNAATA